MVSESQKCFEYTLAIVNNQLDEEGIPVFSLGKFLHVVQNVSRNYSDSFAIRGEDEYVYEDGEFRRQQIVYVTFTDIPEDEVNSIASDICAFMNLDEIKIRKDECEYYSVSESLS